MVNSAAIDRADSKTGGSTIRTGKLTMNLDNRAVMVDGNPVHLTRKEYEVLELLTLRKGTILTKEMLFTRLYDGAHEPEPKIIDVFVCKLRKKLSTATVSLYGREEGKGMDDRAFASATELTNEIRDRRIGCVILGTKLEPQEKQDLIAFLRAL